ncbi:hypothetical protein BMH30_14155 [Leucobacter sp. OLES1]|nr:hypothetical protein BMH30_14155 [Leucobacter sp. OLES1]
MRILIVGASGHVGSAAAAALREKHEVVGVSRSTEPGVDLSDAASIERLFAELGEFDAVVSAYGSAPFKPAPDLTPEDLTAAFEGKVLSQLNLVRIGLAHVRDGGSFTLTTGILAREAVPTGAAAAMANGAVESFVISAAGDAPTLRRALRSGALACLLKPFEPRMLAERLERYARFRNLLAGTGAVAQEDLDRALAILNGSSDPVSLSRSATEKLILDALGAEERSASEVAERAGISRATAQRHLAALAARSVVEVRLRYGSTGRPEHRYTLASR